MEHYAEGPNAMEITNQVIAEKSPEVISLNKEVNTEELWLCCPDCQYQCESENTMTKHMNRKPQ